MVIKICFVFKRVIRFLIDKYFTSHVCFYTNTGFDSRVIRIKYKRKIIFVIYLNAILVVNFELY